MTDSQPTACEACGASMQEWALDADNSLLKCPDCGHILRDLQTCNANARSHAWGGIASADRIRNGLTFNNMNRAMAEKRYEPGGNILEIGFGSGILLGKWISKGWKTHGIEAESLEIPIEDQLRENSTLRFCKVETADFPDNTFELVYGIHLIEHLDDPPGVFEKCHRMLNPEGMLYFITPSAESLGLRWFKAHWWNLEDPTHLRFFSPESITRMLSDAGFSTVKVNIPRWDSIMVEANSVLRSLKPKPSKHGILENKLLRTLVMMLAAPFFALRLLVPRLSPSIEIIAVK